MGKTDKVPTVGHRLRMLPRALFCTWPGRFYILTMIALFTPNWYLFNFYKIIQSFVHTQYYAISGKRPNPINEKGDCPL